MISQPTREKQNDSIELEVFSWEVEGHLNNELDIAEQNV